MRYFLDARTATEHFPGIGRYVSNLARAMAVELQTSEELVLLVDSVRLSPWPLPPVSEQIQQVVTAVSPFSLSQQWQIPRLLRQHGAAVYHSPFYLMPYRPGLSTILTVHDLIPQLFPTYFSVRTRLLSEITTRLALRCADHLIVDSVATRQDVLQRYAIKPERVTAVPLAPDPRFTPQSAADVQRIRAQYQLPANYVLYLGINKPHKNLVQLVEAWTAVHPSSVTLVIAGAWDGRYPEARERTQQLAAGEAIRFIGPVADADLPGLYSGAHFFIFPSLYEGFGLPVIEAMACGTAVITSHVSSLPEVAGEAALYVNPHDTADITRQINHLLDNPALIAAYRQKSLAQAQKFTWRDTAVATLNLYRRYS
ncbi:MAG: glycosyltransferase family 4 protein [Anaerolineae bacterium]|nr:glycosyltransferase family 4 protein [Anaerolineae bacterium]